MNPSALTIILLYEKKRAFNNLVESFRNRIQNRTKIFFLHFCLALQDTEIWTEVITTTAGENSTGEKIPGNDSTLGTTHTRIQMNGYSWQNDIGNKYIYIYCATIAKFLSLNYLDS